MAKAPRLGRSSAGGFSPRMGARDPRVRGNAAGLVADADHDKKTIGRDGAGRTRVTALDHLSPLKTDGLTMADIANRLNLIQRLIQGK